MLLYLPFRLFILSRVTLLSQEYVALAAELGINKEFREIALGRVEDGYRSSLHQNAQSAEEWAVFFRRVFQATMFDEVAPYQ